MKILDIRENYASSQQVAALNRLLEDGSLRNISIQGLVASAVPTVLANMQRMLYVAEDEESAGYIYHDLCQLRGENDVLLFPSSYRRAVKYGQKDPANEILRTETLSRLSTPLAAGASSSYPLVVSYPDAMAELVVSKKQFDENTIELAVSQEVDVVQLETKLLQLGFLRQDYVYEPGQYAVRGSILDIYSYSSELPFRIDFFGDEIDTIRTFNVDDQLSKDRKQSVKIVPEMASAAQRIPFTDFLPDDTVVVSKDLLYVHDRIEQVYNEGFSQQALTERLETATEVEQEQIKREMRKESVLCSPTQFLKGISSFRRMEIGGSANSSNVTITFSTIPQPLFHKNFDLLKETMEDYRAKGYKIYILADSDKQHQRLQEILEGLGETFIPVKGSLHEGFIDNTSRSCYFTDHQIFDRFHKYNLKSDKARTGKITITMKELQEMQPGDFLVHVDFGIGKFGGLVRVPNHNKDGGYQERIRLIYQRGDIVDVSIHSLYKISKYRRQDTGEPPRLSTLGTGAWDRLKERTKTRIKDIARDLIKLYAKRRHEKGFAFSPDSYLQQELEASFLYEDTPDQLIATREVKTDMESDRPMDRLICGDVGFGKTEVAVRAAFKAACDSKQVAVLVPTTVLAFQHYQTFKNRLKNLPVRVEYLSRARSPKVTKQILADLKDGKIDILVGTHKLVGKSVEWKDLGLLIIDEEQKFGVSVKEKLRQIKTNIDTLTLSATPIPRTLQFSLMGARDMSIMRTPPPNRYPIQTTLARYGHEVVADAINFEMSRNGQVFLVNDRISNLPEIANMIQRHVPDCRIAIGHGQMNPDELEKILIGFMNYDYDVLISTTIVENGVDISNANTIIINDAHRYGLSDLHQMRGRVGRSNKKAFCYLLSPPKSLLTPEARRRLEALETFSDLGSGFSLAMQDLDIRGAGNLLGAEQSGFMEDLGYETYQKILSQAVMELKNDEFQELYAEELEKGNDLKGSDFVDDCGVESDLELYFPDSYVPGAAERMLLYRELDNIQTEDELEAYRKRMLDRFGPIPHEGEELMQVVLLRRLGKQLGCEKIMLKNQRFTLQFVSNPDSVYYRSKTFGKVIDFVGKNIQRCKFKESNGRRLLYILDVNTVKDGVELLKCLLS